MATIRTLTGIKLTAPLTAEQQTTLDQLVHEEAVMLAMSRFGTEYLDVPNMDARRVRATLETATDISQLRVAALRAVLEDQEARKPKA